MDRRVVEDLVLTARHDAAVSALIPDDLMPEDRKPGHGIHRKPEGESGVHAGLDEREHDGGTRVLALGASVRVCGGNRAQKPERPTVPKKRSHGTPLYRYSETERRGVWSGCMVTQNPGHKQGHETTGRSVHANWSMRSAVGVLYIPEPFEHSKILHIRPSEKRCVLFVVLL